MQRRILVSLILVLISCATLFFNPMTSPTTAAFGQDEATAPRANELLVIDINRPVTKDDRGFPRNDPPRAEANGNWTTPVNFAEGTLHFRVHVRSQPQPQQMRIQLCIWQDQFRLENCGPQAQVSGTSGTVVTWEKPVQELWMKNGKIIDWTRPRQRYGFAIKNMQGKAVSDYNGWNWNGENPNHWYPLDVQMTAVVVAKGATFGGWAPYIDGEPLPTSVPTNTPTNTSEPTAIATATPTPTLTPSVTHTAQPPATGTPSVAPTVTAHPSSTSVPPTMSPTAMPTATATTLSVLLTPTPSESARAIDNYEPNNSCLDASAIDVDASQQEHTVHVADDTDWVKFSATADMIYRIRVITSAELAAQVFTSCDAVTAAVQATISAPEYRFEFAATASGTVYLRIKPPAEDAATPLSYRLAVRELEETQQESVELFLPLIMR